MSAAFSSLTSAANIRCLLCSSIHSSSLVANTVHSSQLWLEIALNTVSCATLVALVAFIGPMRLVRGAVKAYRAQRRADKIRTGGGPEVLTEAEVNEMTEEELRKFEKRVGFKLSAKFPSAPCFVAIRRKKFTSEELKEATNDWKEGSEDAEAFYGHISGWDTSEVTDMSKLFDHMETFDEYIGGWETSNVPNMYHMFQKAAMFNQSIGAWDVSNVTNMQMMFSGALKFNKRLAALG